MVLLGIDLGTNEIRVQTGDSYDDIIKNQGIYKIKNHMINIFINKKTQNI